MEIGGGVSSAILQGVRVSTLCDVNSRNVLRSLRAVGDVERVERETLLLRGNGIRAGSFGQAGGVHGVLLRGLREPGDDDNGQIGSRQFLA